MLFYNWHKIYTAANAKSLEIFKIFEMLVKGTIPHNIRDPIYKYYVQDFRGYSFLLHPEMLLYEAYKYCTKDIAIYLSLASLRPYAEYEVRGILTLPLDDTLRNLRGYLDNKELITIKNGVLHFRYETPPLSIQH